jgi:hypothetical protein
LELKNKAETTSLTEVGTLKSFKKAQEATGRAHVTIDVSSYFVYHSLYNYHVLRSIYFLLVQCLFVLSIGRQPRFRTFNRGNGEGNGEAKSEN